METVDVFETTAASDLKGSRNRHLIEYMNLLSRSFLVLCPYIFQVLYVLCFTRPQYQVSVYRTIGPLSSGASVVARSGIDGDGTEIRRPAERHQGNIFLIIIPDLTLRIKSEIRCCCRSILLTNVSFRGRFT